MGKLSQTQIEFLQQMNIPLSRVFDATGLSKESYHLAMKDLGLWIAYGVSSCDKAGHTLRLRTGHCVQCSPANISFLRRHDENGHVYVAYSLSKKLTKIGTAQDSAERIKNLNSYQYGGACDWRRWFAVHCDRAGKVEATAQTTLAAHSISATYFKNGGIIECRELFSCEISAAVNAVNQAIREIKCSAKIIQKYEAPESEVTFSEKPKILHKVSHGNLKVADVQKEAPTTNKSPETQVITDFLSNLHLDHKIYQETQRLANQLAQKGANTLDELEAMIKIVDSSIAILGLPENHCQALHQCNVSTVRQLLQYSPETIIQLDGIARKARHDISEALAKFGLRFKDHKPQPISAPQEIGKREMEVAPGDMPSPPQHAIAEPPTLAKYQTGDLVRHPSKPDWGTGKILSFGDSNTVTISFDVAGQKALSLNHVQLIKIGSEPKNSTVVATGSIQDQGNKRVNCANCGQPTQFGEQASAQRATLGWCDSCFKQHQRTFQDRVTGETRYFDELRTIDGIKHRYYSPK